jgi:hypothetical protein
MASRTGRTCLPDRPRTAVMSSTADRSVLPPTLRLSSYTPRTSARPNPGGHPFFGVHPNVGTRWHHWCRGCVFGGSDIARERPPPPQSDVASTATFSAMRSSPPVSAGASVRALHGSADAPDTLVRPKRRGRRTPANRCQSAVQDSASFEAWRIPSPKSSWIAPRASRCSRMPGKLGLMRSRPDGAIQSGSIGPVG